MLLNYRATSTLASNSHFTPQNHYHHHHHTLKIKGNVVLCLARRESTTAALSSASTGFVTLTAVVAAAIVFCCGVGETNAIEVRSPHEPEETLANIPQTLSSEECTAGDKECRKKGRIQRPKSRKAESCTINCVTTCIRGGGGSPGEGPFNVRRPLVVFKQGFRSRQYCLVECSDICNLIRDGDDGP